MRTRNGGTRERESEEACWLAGCERRGEQPTRSHSELPEQKWLWESSVHAAMCAAAAVCVVVCVCVCWFRVSWVVFAVCGAMCGATPTTCP